MSDTTFTIEKAIQIQSEQLADWKKLLLPDVYKDLEKWTRETNNTAPKAEDIRRGTSLDNFIGNYHIILSKKESIKNDLDKIFEENSGGFGDYNKPMIIDEIIKYFEENE